MKVEIWSDIVCPWCAIGKRRFEAALARFADRDAVEVHWRSFELDPAAPRERSEDLTAHLAQKYRTTPQQAQAMQDHMTTVAAAEGWTFRLDRARQGNTFDAHRLLHLAGERGIQDAVKQRLLAAYLSDGEPIGSREALVRLGGEAGLEPAEARVVLEGDDYADAVRADEREAAALGATGVPFFVIDRRYGVAGAQPAEVLLAALERAWDESRRTPVLVGGAASDDCADGSCAV